jgi:hypothetical protein
MHGFPKQTVRSRFAQNTSEDAALAAFLKFFKFFFVRLQ